LAAYKQNEGWHDTFDEDEDNEDKGAEMENNKENDDEANNDDAKDIDDNNNEDKITMTATKVLIVTHLMIVRMTAPTIPQGLLQQKIKRPFKVQ
jgi:hypothetical protein